MSLTRSDVERIALLARLELTGAELDMMTEQLGRILDFMSQLEELDTDSVAPMAHVADVSNVFREDEVRDSLPRDQALAAAPRHDDECFQVPAVLGD
jgi:aspartyl-tRNA(Asn)/glutamyl-tRNA(Gln) amidotransferase subunit C